MIRFVFFDAVGTVLHPYPSVSEIYRQVGLKFGSKLPLEQLRLRVRRAFAQQEELDKELAWATSETRERNRWKTIVAESLPDVSHPVDCFEELYRFFAERPAWQLDSRVVEWVGLLDRQGIRMGLASNFDHRLRALIELFPELKRFAPVLISSEIGWRKPSASFYHQVIHQSGVTAQEILFVGDHPEFDVERPKKHGMSAVLVGEFSKDPSRFLQSTRPATGSRVFQGV